MYRGETVCEEPLLTVDRQMGLNIVHPEGKVMIFTLAQSSLLIFVSFRSLIRSLNAFIMTLHQTQVWSFVRIALKTQSFFGFLMDPFGVQANPLLDDVSD